MGLLDLIRRDGAASLWLLDELSGTVARDSIGSNHGTYAGTYTLGQPSLIYGDGRKSTTFGGGYVDIPDAASLSPEAGAGGVITTEALVKATALPSAGGVRHIITKGNVNAYEWGMVLYDTGGVYGQVWDPSGQPIAQAIVLGSANPVPVTTDNLFHIVWTWKRSGPSTTMYINGVAVAASTALGAAGNVNATRNSAPVRIGARGDGGTANFSGQLGPVALYPVELSATTVQEHYRALLRGGVTY